MTKEWFFAFNNKCTKFTGWDYNFDSSLYYPSYEFAKAVGIGQGAWTLNALRFHSDWNWIMEVKSKICQLNIIDEFNTSYDSVAKGWYCQLLPAHRDSFSAFYGKILSTEKEAVIEAIDQFIDWYNKQKEL